jgi:Ca2+-binding EF-hand superfamily protein
MKTSTRILLLAGAAIIAAGGIAAAPLTAPAAYSGHVRASAGARLFSEYDLNHDGKITKAEADRVAAQRFAEDSHGAAAITERQFADATSAKLRQRASQAFKRLDWNGDGKLSLAEYSGFAHATFQRMDRAGDGVISCTHPAAFKPAADNARGHRRSGGHSLCASSDLNKDGKVTRAELDRTVAAKFATAAQGGSSLSPQQFFALTYSRYANGGAHGFARLDANKDGKVTKDEFTVVADKIFARLDTNNDGTITKAEAAAHRGHGRQDGKPERS